MIRLFSEIFSVTIFGSDRAASTKKPRQKAVYVQPISATAWDSAKRFFVFQATTAIF